MTVNEAREHIAPFVGPSGTCPEDPTVLEAINAARRILYPLGDWKDIVDPKAITPYQGQVTLPSTHEFIRKAWLFRNRVTINSMWWEPIVDPTINVSCDVSTRLIDMGDRYGSFRDYAYNFRIKMIAQSNLDAGVSVKFDAISEEGEPVTLNRTVVKAWEPIIADPINDKWIKSFSCVRKPETNDRILVYIFDPVRGFEALCAVYEARDVNPTFRRYKLQNIPTNAPIGIMAKRRYVPLVNENQPLDINPDALIHGVQAIAYRRSRDHANYMAQVSSAKDLLRRELADANGFESQGITIHGGATVSNLEF